MIPLTSWDGVKIGDHYTLLNTRAGALVGFSVGDQVKIVDKSHTGYRVHRVPDGYVGFVYYPDQITPYPPEEYNNEQASAFLLEED